MRDEWAPDAWYSYAYVWSWTRVWRFSPANADSWDPPTSSSKKPKALPHRASQHPFRRCQSRHRLRWGGWGWIAWRHGTRPAAAGSTDGTEVWSRWLEIRSRWPSKTAGWRRSAWWSRPIADLLGSVAGLAEWCRLYRRARLNQYVLYWTFWPRCARRPWIWRSASVRRLAGSTRTKRMCISRYRIPWSRCRMSRGLSGSLGSRASGCVPLGRLI